MVCHKSLMQFCNFKPCDSLLGGVAQSATVCTLYERMHESKLKQLPHCHNCLMLLLCWPYYCMPCLLSFPRWATVCLESGCLQVPCLLCVRCSKWYGRPQSPVLYQVFSRLVCCTRILISRVAHEQSSACR